MSEVLENTFSSLSRLLNENLISSISGSPPTNVKPQGCSKGFENFIRAVSGARNKHEEDGIIKRELSLLHQRLSQPDVSTNQMKDYMVRVVYCGMLGHNINFACIHAVKLAQHGKLQEKRIGYLAASLLLHEDHELILLLINTIQKDLSSSNLLENCMGLMAICQLVNTEMAPMLLPSVIEKLKHPKAVVRKKAVMCLQKFQLKSPASVQHLTDRFREALCDKDPGVMSAALHIYLQLVQDDPEKHRGLVQGCVNVLNQVINRKFPADYEYHAIPAPWVQVKLLKILAALGKGQQRASSLMYTVLRETLERATVKDNAAFAILYECVVTITTIWPSADLLHTAASYVGKFLRSKGNNLRFAGLKALGHLVKSGPEFVTDYQMIVVECLEDSDQAIQKKTYDLLYQMTNTSNVGVICKRLMDYLAKSRDEFVQSELIAKITELVVNYAPSPQWYISSMNQLMEVSGDKTPTQASKSLLNIIQKGCCEADPAGGMLREFVVDVYQGYIHRPSLPSSLLSVTAWALGEYSHSVTNFDELVARESFVRHYQSAITEDKSRHYILTALQKMFIYGVITATKLHSVINMVESSTKGSNLRQRIMELKMLSSFEPNLVHRLKPESNGKTLDFTLSFLDDYVSEALEGGSMAYRPRQIRLIEGNKKNTEVKSILDEIHYERYSSSAGSPRSGNSGDRGDSRPLDGSTGSVYSGSGKQETRSTGLNMAGVKKVWGRGGVTQTDTSAVDTNTGSDEGPSDLKPLPQQQQHSAHTQKGDEDRQKKEDLAAALFSGLGSSSSLTSGSPIIDRGAEGQHSLAYKPESSQHISASSSLQTQWEKPKPVDVLVKYTPSDGHDWRNFRKSENDSEFSEANQSVSISSTEMLVDLSASLSDVEIAKNNPASSANFCSRAIESLPPQQTENSPERNQMLGECDWPSESSHLQESSLYDTLMGELTEEELVNANESSGAQQRQRSSQSEKQS